MCVTPTASPETWETRSAFHHLLLRALEDASIVALTPDNDAEVHPACSGTPRT
jgi:hypothetical protein